MTSGWGANQTLEIVQLKTYIGVKQTLAESGFRLEKDTQYYFNSVEKKLAIKCFEEPFG